MARQQSAGRGRGARRWISEPGNLHLSVLLEIDLPLQRLPELSFLAAIAAHKAVHRLANRAGRDLDLSLKWPNDLLLDGCKLAGVILESHSKGKAKAAVIIGWGINLVCKPDKSRWPAVSLAEHGVKTDPQEALAILQDSFGRWFDLWCNKGFSPVRKAWMKRAWGVGHNISVISAGQVVRGVFTRLGENGAMMLKMADGSIKRINTGEVGLVCDLER